MIRENWKTLMYPERETLLDLHEMSDALCYAIQEIREASTEQTNAEVKAADLHARLDAVLGQTGE